MRVNIKNRPGLQRDINSGAVINTDITAYQKALNAKAAAEQKENELQDIKNEVQDLKILMNKIIERLS
jgi:vacuolar-type H+-ATPase subunit D/Vma8